MNTDKNVTAIFVEQLPQHTLTINIVGSGSVTKDPNQTTYDEDSSVTLTAVPVEGWTFTEWSGDLISTTNPETIVMDTDKTITVTFVEGGLPTYTLTTGTVGSGSISKSPDKAEYDLDETVELTANADPGWVFANWTGDLTGAINPETITMDGNKAVTAHFIESTGIQAGDVIISGFQSTNRGRRTGSC